MKKRVLLAVLLTLGHGVAECPAIQAADIDVKKDEPTPAVAADEDVLKAAGLTGDDHRADRNYRRVTLDSNGYVRSISGLALVPISYGQTDDISLTINAGTGTIRGNVFTVNQTGPGTTTLNLGNNYLGNNFGDTVDAHATSGPP